MGLKRHVSTEVLKASALTHRMSAGLQALLHDRSDDGITHLPPSSLAKTGMFKARKSLRSAKMGLV